MRRRASGTFELSVSAGEAIDYFTPEGERNWAPGWDPVYPDGEPGEAAGTVFITHHAGTETIWVIVEIDRTAHTAAYTRLTPGRHAGTVRVRCEDRPPGRCLVSAEYDMTSLLPADPHVLDAYDEESFAEMMQEWARRVTTHLGQASPD